MYNYSSCIPVELKCEYISQPLGIDVVAPRLMWQLLTHNQQVSQSAYQIVVATSVKALLAGESLFDSGKVFSGESVNILCPGLTLQARQRYYWRVRVWDQDDILSVWSTSSYWEMALLEAEEWQACWIEAPLRPNVPSTIHHVGQVFMPEEPIDPKKYTDLNPCSFLRRSFFVNAPIASARLYITARGVYQAQLNGAQVSDTCFAPGVSAYDRRLEYQTYDVSSLIQPGNNVIGVILADGWYLGRIGFPGCNNNYGDRRGLLLQLEIVDVDGRRTVISSDDKFLTASGPFIYSDLFIGEKYDARQELNGWSDTSYDDSDWQPARLSADQTLSTLVAAYGEPVRQLGKLFPQAVIHTPEGDTVLDMGQNFTGRIQMCVFAPAGTVITLEHSEVLDEKGNFFKNIIGNNKEQTDIYIAKGSDEEIWQPTFTFHGFRYVRVSGYPGEVRKENFTGIVLGTDLAVTGSFQCSDERINRLQACILWSQRSNFLAIPTDCPQRERAGWTGDINIYAPTATFNMHVAAFLSRWLRDMRLEQKSDGQIPLTVPHWQGDIIFSQMLFGDDVSSSGWGDACVTLPWTLWTRYRDRRVLEENYPMMKRWMAWVQEQAEEHIPQNIRTDGTAQEQSHHRYLQNSGFHFGDWLAPGFLEKDNSNAAVMRCMQETKEIVATCWYARSSAIMAEIAGVLELPADRDKYLALKENIAAAFTAEYVQEDNSLSGHYQGLYVLALASDVIPTDRRQQVFFQLVKLIEDNGRRLDTGFMSIAFLMDVLCHFGREDLACDLLFQTDCPSWLYEVARGATTLWERWNAIDSEGHPTQVSYNHYAFGCVGDWMYRHLGGIHSRDAGYKTVTIAPRPCPQLNWVAASYQSDYGTLASRWEINDGIFRLEITIPANSEAIIILQNAARSYLEGNLIASIEINLAESKINNDDSVSIPVKAGKYYFRYPWNN